MFIFFTKRQMIKKLNLQDISNAKKVRKRPNQSQIKPLLYGQKFYFCTEEILIMFRGEILEMFLGENQFEKRDRL